MKKLFTIIGIALGLFVQCREQSSSAPESAISQYQQCMTEHNDESLCKSRTNVTVRRDEEGTSVFEYMGMYYMMRSLTGGNSTTSIQRYSGPTNFGSSTSTPTYRSDPETTRPSSPRSGDSTYGSARNKPSESSNSTYGSTRTQKPADKPSSSYGTSRPRSSTSSSSSGRSSSSYGSSSSGRSSSSSSSSSGRSSGRR